MQSTNDATWSHGHDYLSDQLDRNERQTRLVIALTAVMMVVEISAGMMFGSIALLADGWHMASHASALGITAFAYWFARRHRQSARYSFGTWKVSVLGGFTSAIVLGLVALLIVWESAVRFLNPEKISFDQAISVAFVGLVVNIVSAWMLRDGHEHHDHHHDQDYNLRAAYLHVLSDAIMSVAAILALGCGKLFGWWWMDPAMGIVGSLIIGRWAYALVCQTSSVLLDGDVEENTLDAIRLALEKGSEDRVPDLHVWRVGPDRLAAIAVIVTGSPRPPDEYKRIMQSVVSLAHVTVEVNQP
ncbi:MAG: cation transporter [bacterium TMED88]|nr:cation transporter [Deltaproteobacteria bacterium]OUV25445.1 MAG: cation transporter [bacterium TMED88]